MIGDVTKMDRLQLLQSMASMNEQLSEYEDEIQALRNERTDLAEEVSRLKASGGEGSDVMASVQWDTFAEQIATAHEIVKTVQQTADEYIMQVRNKCDQLEQEAQERHRLLLKSAHDLVQQIDSIIGQTDELKA